MGGVHGVLTSQLLVKVHKQRAKELEEKRHPQKLDSKA